MNLNESQLEAVTCDLNPTLVIAGPGTGKTNVIIHRINHMINNLGCDAHNILVVTFSKLAAEEMKNRYQRSFGISSVTFGTLHSIFYKVLRRYDANRYSIDNLLSEDKRRMVLENLIKQSEISEEEDFLDSFISHSSKMKNELISSHAYTPVGINKSNFVTLLNQYDNYKETNGCFDFDDMLIDCYHVLEDNPKLLLSIQNQYKYILIDEFQDINEVQFQIIKNIASKYNSIFVVGDDDQSIYQFRGAKPKYLLEFAKEFKNSKSIYLNINYRCSKSILNHSSSLIQNNKTRFSKNLYTLNPNGIEPVYVNSYDPKEESRFITNEIIKYKNLGVCLQDIAIIFRTNIQARSIVEALLTANIPFCLREHIVSLYDQWITQDLLSYLYLAYNINQPQIVNRILNKPKRYISKASLDKASKMEGHLFMNLLSLDELTEWQKDYIHQLLYDLQVIREKDSSGDLESAIKYIRTNIGYNKYVSEYAKFRNMPESNLIDVLDDIEDSSKSFSTHIEWINMLKDMSDKIKSQNRNTNEEMVNLTTMHGSKGLEFRVVFLTGLVEGIIPHKKSTSESDVEEERRLMYVGMTRAKQKLYLCYSKMYHNKEVAVSKFVEEIKSSIFDAKINVGKYIIHKVLGRGIISQKLENNIILVEFIDGITRKIDSHYALKNGIIKLEEENNEKTN